MGREGKLHCRILTYACIIMFMTGCQYAEDIHEQIHDVKISFEGCGMMSRAYDPDEDKITDISLMIFDETGDAEECIWLPRGEKECTARLIMNKEYTFCACANFGYQVYADHIDELEEIRFHMAYPDEYREGIPMYTCEKVTVTEDPHVTLTLERLMAKISLRMDRSRLSEGVEMNVRSVRIGNCPRSAKVFGQSKAEDEDDCFPTGFARGDLESDALNISAGNGLSKEISLYMLENMQGQMDRHIVSDMDKVFEEDDLRSKTCSYIEMELEYLSYEKYSGPDGLIYRFYLGEDRNSLDVERNCHYHITVAPEDDGLSEDSWRVDKSGLMDMGRPYIKGYPSDYIRGDIGDKIHLWCKLMPWNAPLVIDTEVMDEDKAEGIYDYVIDEDGHGVTLTLTGPGSGIVYMEAGDPINDAALFIIEVNLP